MNIDISHMEVLPMPQVPFEASQLTYADMYATVEPSWLLQNFGAPLSVEEEIESVNRFAIDQKLNALPHITHCISISLFCKNNDSRDDKILPKPSTEIGGPWHTKYFEPFKKFLKDFHETSFFHNWKIRVYAEPEMLEILNNLPSTRMEIYVMGMDSVGASPGTLWRFMAFGDKALDMVYVADIDEALVPNIGFIEAFLMDSSKGLGRFIHPPSTNDFFVDQSLLSKNYAPIWGNRVACRPRVLNFDVASAMKAFVVMRIRGIQSSAPWKVMPTDVANSYNVVSPGNHPHGWGNHYHGYCFDERFLKHVVYPYAVANGMLQTWTTYDWRLIANLNEEVRADLSFTATHANNSIIKVH